MTNTQAEPTASYFVAEQLREIARAAYYRLETPRERVTKVLASPTGRVTPHMIDELLAAQSARRVYTAEFDLDAEGISPLTNAELIARARVGRRKAVSYLTRLRGPAQAAMSGAEQAEDFHKQEAARMFLDATAPVEKLES